MKHIFVVNPCAGGRDRSHEIAAALAPLDIEAEIYCTTATADATRYVAACIACKPAGGLRFYACGGDGTLNEVVAGVLKAVGSAAAAAPEVEVACYPCGSGNDYVKNWPGVDFGNLEHLVGGTAVPVDVMRVGDFCCINVLNYGFEAEVCRGMQQVRRWPLLGGRMAYTSGILYSLVTKRHNPCRISVDGQLWRQGDLLLASAANGQYVGGGYRCAPRAVVDDGRLEVLAIDSLSIVRFLGMIGHYKRGEHLDCEEMRRVVHSTGGRKVTIEADREFSIVVDGELHSGRRFDIEVLPQALNFVLPGGPGASAQRKPSNTKKKSRWKVYPQYSWTWR